METKGTENAGRTAKLRKILSIICLVLLAIVAVRSWMRKTEAGTAEIIGGADKPTVAVLLPDEGESSTAAHSNESAGPEAPSAQAETDGAISPGWCGLNIGDSPLLEEITDDEPAPTPSPLEQSDPGIPAQAGTGTAQAAPPAKIAEDGLYTSKEDVALYIHTYGHLPANFITKAEAKALGWGDKYGSVDDAAPGKSIGGDRFSNREGLLPKKKGRTYTECDIGTMGKKSRGARRIVFSNDGLVYYTGDHYETFELLYGNE